MKCWQIQGTFDRGNVEVQVEDASCAGKRKPDSWAACIMPPAKGSVCKLGTGGAIRAGKRPRLKTVSHQFVQMRRGPRVRLRCGQKATLIPGTNVVIGCGVVNYNRRQLSWQLPGQHPSKLHMAWRGAAANGRGRGRVFVDRSGRLRIRKFRVSDVGSYKVHADNESAHVQLDAHSAYKVSDAADLHADSVTLGLKVGCQ